MKLIGNNEYWVKNGTELPSDFDSMDDDEKDFYIWDNDFLHREDGPAVIYPGGSKYWFLNGLQHRLDDPAVTVVDIIFPFGPEWWLNGIEVDGEIYQKIQNSSKEELLIYMINPEYEDYLPLIEYRLNL